MPLRKNVFILFERLPQVAICKASPCEQAVKKRKHPPHFGHLLRPSDLFPHFKLVIFLKPNFSFSSNPMSFNLSFPLSQQHVIFLQPNNKSFSSIPTTCHFPPTQQQVIFLQLKHTCHFPPTWTCHFPPTQQHVIFLQLKQTCHFPPTQILLWLAFIKSHS